MLQSFGKGGLLILLVLLAGWLAWGDEWASNQAVQPGATDNLGGAVAAKAADPEAATRVLMDTSGFSGRRSKAPDLRKPWSGIRGRIRLQNREPVAGAQISLCLKSPEWRRQIAVVDVDDDGNFQVADVPFGEIVITGELVTPGILARYVVKTVRYDGGALDAGDMVLDSTGTSMRFSVNAPDGAPCVARIGVGDPGAGISVRAVTSPLGQFEFRGLPQKSEGGYKFSVMNPDFERAEGFVVPAVDYHLYRPRLDDSNRRLSSNGMWAVFSDSFDFDATIVLYAKASPPAEYTVRFATDVGVDAKMAVEVYDQVSHAKGKCGVGVGSVGSGVTVDLPPGKYSYCLAIGDMVSSHPGVILGGVSHFAVGEFVVAEGHLDVAVSAKGAGTVAGFLSGVDSLSAAYTVGWVFDSESRSPTVLNRVQVDAEGRFSLPVPSARRIVLEVGHAERGIRKRTLRYEYPGAPVAPGGHVDVGVITGSR